MPDNRHHADGRDAAIARNLAAVAAHMRDEVRDPAAAMALYAPGAILEVPGRGLLLTTPSAIETNYRRMFAAMADVEMVSLDRFATEDRVVDDTLVRFRLIAEGMDNAPVPIGARAEVRLVHIFVMRDGLIARESVLEVWRRLD
jgi:hypothetical protein